MTDSSPHPAEEGSGIPADDEPAQVSKRAIDVTPLNHAIWCTVEGGPSDPFANAIVGRKWSKDGSQIVFMLDSHNFDFRDPEEEMLVVEIPPIYNPALFADCLRKDDEAMRKRPSPPRRCSSCGQEIKP